ncbi:type VII secretion protein EccB [Actinacidiphila glaucinigra]|uniref:type VII secretion protein EccB n=1 Tax=Actinacidiphila glaucinigra TaxID=235986 RepID=UPI0035E281B5
MQTRRDHMQAYQFAMGRLASALVTGDPGTGESPTKRSALGSFFGVGIVILLCAGFLVYGKLSPVATEEWRKPGSIIVEKETGSRFLFIRGQLRPVRNYASALLLTGKSGTVRTVGAKSLTDVPRGAPLGIEGAPDSLPTPANLLPQDWSLCLRPDLASGHVLDFAPGARTSAFPADRHLLLKSPDGKQYVLWRGSKYPVPSFATLIALGLDGDRPIRASAAWLASLPTGEPLAPAKIDGAGRAAGKIAGKPVTVGQVFVTSAAGTKRSYVMTDDGVAPVSATEAALLVAQRGAPAPLRVSAADIAAARLSSDSATRKSALPDVLDAPVADTTTHTVCLRGKLQSGKRSLTVVLGSGPAATGNQAVLVPPSHGVYAVDEQQLAARTSNPQTYLITDRGIAYPMGDSSAAPALGLSGGSVTPLPKSLLAMLPRGPVLDRTAAALTVQPMKSENSPSPSSSPSPLSRSDETQDKVQARRAGVGTPVLPALGSPADVLARVV